MTDDTPPPCPREALRRLLECPDLNLDELEPETIAAIETAKASLALPDSQDHGVCHGIRLTRSKDGVKVTLDYGTVQVEVISTKRLDYYVEGWKIGSLVKKALAAAQPSEAA